MISQELIDKYVSEINDTFATEDRDKYFEIANKLYKETNQKNSYFLGAAYLNGWGTQIDNNYACLLLTGAADNNDNYDYACYLAAIAYYRCNDFFKAFDWFCKAEKAGVRDSIALFADSAAGCTFNLWNEVRHQLSQSTVTQGAARVKNYMAVAIELYMEAAEKTPEAMDATLYSGYAKLMILMYNMATTGMLDMDVVAFDSLSGTVAGGIEALKKMLDTEAHNETLAKCIIGAHFIEEHGYPLVAEYLRAQLAVMESLRDRSAHAFYRARWHMIRIGQLQNTTADAALVANIFAEMNDDYRNAENKYGATVMNMMKMGQMPDLTKSFLPDNAPAPESCENFMNVCRQLQADTQNQAPVNKPGGFLKNLFKF